MWPRRPPHSEQPKLPCLRGRPPPARRWPTRLRWQIEVLAVRVRATNRGTSKRVVARPSISRETTFATSLQRVSHASSPGPTTVRGTSLLCDRSRHSSHHSSAELTL